MGCISLHNLIPKQIAFIIWRPAFTEDKFNPTDHKTLFDAEERGKEGPAWSDWKYLLIFNSDQ